MSENTNARLSSTCVVQIVLQPTFGTLIVELPSARNKKQQVVPEHNTITISLQRCKLSSDIQFSIAAESRLLITLS